MINAAFRAVSAQAGYRLRVCQCICAVLLVLAVAGCQSKRTATGIIGSVKGFAGGVVADEPRAALAARDVLTAGGSAADAAVALYFTLAVTLPSTAGLGGGGVCLVHDPDSERSEMLDFLPRAVPGGVIGMPGNVRGMAALQAKYGRLKWDPLLARAEELARGTSVSRALARELATAGTGLLGDGEIRRAFARADGGLPREGDGLQQIDLAGTIGQIRRVGAGSLYTGTLAMRTAQSAQDVGLPLSAEVLRGTLPQFGAELSIDVGGDVAYFPAPPADGGVTGAQLLALLSAGGSYAGAGDADRPQLFVAAAKRAFLDRARWVQPDGMSSTPTADLLSAAHLQAMDEGQPPGGPAGVDENPWASGFVVADQYGMTVACEVTMNRLFGSGRMVPGTGIILAAAPRGPGGFPLGPMIVARRKSGDVEFAAAASGGSTATTAAIAVFLDTAVLKQPLDAALAAKRIHHNGTPDTAFYEAGVSDAVLAGLQQHGYATAAAGVLGRVNALWCPKGLRNDPDTCQVGNDPRGDGLAVLQSPD
ncbi:MAG TPA: gamma-glutamyltransferase [Methylomirabilota bacterium]|nr:gamma-glutamyltransferase [Methylomirabilota bacterium]